MKKTCILLMLVLSCALVFAGGSQESAEVSPSDLPTERVEASGMLIEWSYEADEMIFSITAPTDGWVSLGIDPTKKMKDAQYVIGYVSETGEVVISDQFGTGSISHKADTDIGGSSDVRIITAVEENSTTMLIFALPIDSGDQYDVSLTRGEAHTLIFAYGRKDDLSSKHQQVGKAEVRF